MLNYAGMEPKAWQKVQPTQDLRANRAIHDNFRCLNYCFACISRAELLMI